MDRTVDPASKGFCSALAIHLGPFLGRSLCRRHTWKLQDVPDVNGEDLSDCDPYHGSVAEVEEEDVGHEEGERQPPDVGSVRPRALAHGPV